MPAGLCCRLCYVVIEPPLAVPLSCVQCGATGDWWRWLPQWSADRTMPTRPWELSDRDRALLWALGIASG